MFSRKLFQWWFVDRQLNRTSKQGGFTLIELLVSIVIASLVIASLLYLVVELMQINRRETVLNEVQIDMQRALDYINRDAREAVFVYSDPTTVTDELDDLPVDAEPVLAFWRPDPINVSDLDCEDYTEDTDERKECDVLKIRQNAYSLVVYLQKDNDPNTDIWGGLSRIIRYELPKYRTVNTLEHSSGYIDPVSEGSGFETWEPSSTEDTAGSAQVLVDYVAAPDTADPPGEDADYECPATGNYVRTPTDIAAGNSFFVCTRDDNTLTDDDGEVSGRQNQDLVVYLRGSTFDGRQGLFGTAGLNERSVLPTLKSDILIRGVLDKYQ